MDPLTLAALMAVGGLAKSQFLDKPKADRQRKLAAKTQELSPWTGLRANPIQEADPFGSALQFGATGAMMGANMQKAEADKLLAEKMKNSASPWNFTYNTGSAPGTGYLGNFDLTNL